jgi:hypothetical protein
MPFAALRCTSCARDRVADSEWWIEFILSWKYIGSWFALNARGVFAVGQQAQSKKLVVGC